MMSENSEKLTPMLEQYRSIKKDYPDALLFFRMGDFYELFFDDAKIASRELQIALTSRGKTGGNSAPMCGVPWHAAQSYLAQLVDKGYNIAICEQIEDPRVSKGLVKRAVTTLITPGTALDEANLGAKSHNYLGAVFCGLNDSCAFSWTDVSTGQWSGIEFRKQADLWQWVRKLAPRELLLVDGQKFPAGFNSEGIRPVYQPPINFDLKRSAEKLLSTQGVQDLESLGLESKPALARACGAILNYLEQTQMRQTARLMPFKPLDLGSRLLIDELTERNLEIFTRLNGRKGRGSLRYVIDATITPMGGRLLEDMLRHPWRELKPIRFIQENVAFFYAHDDIRATFRTILEKVYDLERLIMRIYLQRSSPRDFWALKQSLLNLPDLRRALEGESPELVPVGMRRLLDSMDYLTDLAQYLETALADDMPSGQSAAGIFRSGFNAALDEQLELLEHGEARLQELLEREKEVWKFPKLKLGYNKVFGYYYELSKSSLGKDLPEHFIRRQTLANGERFTTPDLKRLEEDLLLAADRRKDLEEAMYEDLRAHVAAQKDRVIQTADLVAQLDYWQALGEVGKREKWTMPEVSDNGEIHIIGGRHPVVESVLGRSNFVPNDFHFDSIHRLCLLTGPNMAGKSTVLRQIALITLLAQMGSMVPAIHAEIGIADRIFSRVGASDNLAQGQSTFMVEMMETARILRQATRRSLIILDEIGRGTSTFDGMALAWAVVEDLAGRCQGQLRTIFATHYHELTGLEGRVKGLFTMNIAVGSYDNNEILFLHRLVPGPSDKSYGVEVARIAGVPYPVVQRARDILKNLENDRSKQASEALSLPGISKKSKDPGNDLIKALRKLDLDSLTPDAAYKLIADWKKRWDGTVN